jgi:DNA-binding GntR family transcriptional regulator
MKGKIKGNAEERAYQFIKNKIIALELSMNEQIVEAQIVKQMGISRTPVRAALKRLHYEGLVNIIPNKGAFVTQPTYKEVKDVFECKMYLETHAIKIACSKITQEDIEELEKLIDEEKVTHENRDLKRFIDINYKFHMIIAKATQNQYFEKYISELMNKSNIHLIFFDDFRITPLEEAEAYREHRRILDALKEGNEEKCIKEMSKHIDNTFVTLDIR